MSTTTRMYWAGIRSGVGTAVATAAAITAAAEAAAAAVAEEGRRQDHKALIRKGVLFAQKEYSSFFFKKRKISFSLKAFQRYYRTRFCILFYSKSPVSCT